MDLQYQSFFIVVWSVRFTSVSFLWAVGEQLDRHSYANWELDFVAETIMCSVGWTISSFIAANSLFCDFDLIECTPHTNIRKG